MEEKGIADFIKGYSNGDRRYVCMGAIQRMGYDYGFLSEMTLKGMEKLIISLKPFNAQKVKDIVYSLQAYSEFLGDYESLGTANSLDSFRIWQMCKLDVDKLLISHKEFVEITDEVDKDDYGVNKLQNVTMLKCVYEGMYDGKLLILRNLRKQDLHINNAVTLHDGNDSWNIYVDDGLMDALRELAERQTVETKNGESEAIGYYGADSIFKVHSKKSTNTDNIGNALRKRMWRIMKKYYVHSIQPHNIFLSGLCHRIYESFKANGVDLVDYISSRHETGSLGDRLVRIECKKVHYSVPRRVRIKSLFESNIEKFVE